MAASNKTEPSPGSISLDQETLIAIYDETYPLILRYISRRVGDAETARDLAADVYHRLLQANAAGRGPDSSAKAWLYRTAHNIVIDYYRRQNYRRQEPLTENIGQPAAVPSGGSLSSVVEVKIQAEVVRTAIAQLTPDQQQVISLRFLEGLSLGEVSEIAGKPVGAVKSLQHRGLAALRQQLERQKEFDEQPA